MFTMSRERVTHIEHVTPTPSNVKGERITHPWQWEISEDDGTGSMPVAYVNTKAEARAWIANHS